MSTALAVRSFGCSAQVSTAVNRSRMALFASVRNRAVDGCGTGCCVQPFFIAARMARRWAVRSFAFSVCAIAWSHLSSSVCSKSFCTYVRLFALGLSGGILAGVFNSLAVGMSPDNVIAGPIVMVLIFVIGHAINIFMNVLGAMVHPMRLTFVEFFKNSGYEGGGKEYKPFRNLE